METGSPVPTKLVSSVPYVREMIIGYLELSNVFGNEIGGCLKTGLSFWFGLDTVIVLYLVLLNYLKKFRFHEW